LSNVGTSGVDNAISRYTSGWVSPATQKQKDPNAQKLDAINDRLDSMQPTSQGQPAQAAPVAAPVAAPAAALPAPAPAPAAAPNPLAQRPAATSFAGLGIRGPRPAPSKPAVGSVRINTPRPQGFGNFGIQGPQAPAPALPAPSAPNPPPSSPAAPKPPAVTGAQPAAPKAPRMNTGQGKARIQAGITQKLGIPRAANAAAGVANSVLRLRRALSNASS
jgi:hypothetical protein